MLNWTVEYENFNGDKKQKRLYFNFSRTEIVDLVANGEFDPDEMQKAIGDEDDKKIYQFIVKLIKMSYGIKSEDGEYFRKSPAITRDLLDSPVYDALIMDVLSNDKKALKFFTGVFPKELLEEAKKNLDSNLVAIENLRAPKSAVIDVTPRLEDLSKEELIARIENMKRGETEGVKTPS